MEGCIWRGIYGSEAEQGLWGIRNSQEWCQVCEDLDTAANIKREIMAWTGHPSSENGACSGSYEIT